MKKMYLLVVILFTTTLGFGQNLVANGGFETWTDASKKADDWYKTESSAPETTIFHSGAQSLKATSTTKTKDLGTGYIDITGGKIYKISYWFLDNDPKAKARIWSSWRDASGWLTDNADVLHTNDFSTDNKEWQHFEVTLTAPATATQFSYEVRHYYGFKDNSGVKQAGGVIYFDDFSLTEETSLSNNLFDNASISIYPNPAVNVITFKSSINSIGSFEIFNTSGQLLINSKGNLSSKRIDVSSLSKGSYILKVTSDENSHTYKIIK